MNGGARRRLATADRCHHASCRGAGP